ncbi:hypothetical protein SJ05684_c06860 [Sinorhizobium sojae CCBAU 05684]|uniref:PilZ domain-containing protein n=1 Tax=Sinorhizobium sojae CCBAU 05684 TaxID=716928 RepID=A0A249P881_9HYPH|nr:hypothetical protein [Sinorhizobium sojae]ASY62150.1 hypothetical protein SJ05684_c06860 [Sinorhizobium sojae CCBAU 05684]
MSMIMHLAQSGSGRSSGTYPHYAVERPCRILVIGSQLKAKTRYQALLRHISIGGAMLDFNAAILLPKHFFLEIDGFSEEIGCAEVYRNGAELGVRFNMLLAQEFLRQLIRMQYASGL